MMNSYASRNHCITREVQSTIELSRFMLPALRYHILCIVHVTQLAWGAFTSRLGVKTFTKSWEAHQLDLQFGEEEILDIWKSQRLCKEGNVGINKMTAMRPGLAKILKKTGILINFESLETNHHIVVNAWCIDYTNTWLSKEVHWLSTSQAPHSGTPYCGCEDTVELNSGDAWASLPIRGIHARVAQKPLIQW